MTPLQAGVYQMQKMMLTSDQKPHSLETQDLAN